MLKIHDWLLLKLNLWPKEFNKKYTVEFRKPGYPNQYRAWRELYAACATLRHCAFFI